MCLAFAAFACGDTHDRENDSGFDGGSEPSDGGPARAGRASAGSPSTGVTGGRSGRAGAGGASRAGSGGMAGPTDGGAAAMADGGGGAGGSAGACANDNGGCGDPRYARCFRGQCYPVDQCAQDNGGCDPRTLCQSNTVGQPATCGPCPSGYTGTGSTGCIDIDECLIDNGGCGDPTRVECWNDVGVYACLDREECVVDNGGCGDPAQHFCVEQHAAAPLCETDECLVDNGGCGSPEAARCKDAPGEARVCKSKPKYINAWRATCVGRIDGSTDCWFPTRRMLITQSVTGFEQFGGMSWGCGLETAGSIRCIGPPQALAAVPSGTDFTSLALSIDQACALRSNGTAACWGTDQSGSVSGPNAETGLRQVAVGQGSCVVRQAGTLACFGTSPLIDAANADGGTDFVAVAMDDSNICALRSNATGTCWGDDTYGQLTGFRQAGGTFQSLSVGPGQICGLRPDTTVECWGHDMYGQTTGPNAAERGVVQVYAGSRTCLMWSDGTFRCYGWAAGVANSDLWARPLP
jgi:hypothetical protein